MPSDLGFKTLNAVHGAVKKLSGGRIGWRAGGMPVLELTTTGRRSGEKRSTMLTIPWQDDRSIAVVASRAGDDRHPAWFLNLRDDPAVSVSTRSGTRPMTARILAGDERSEMWERITRAHDNYADYQKKTDREIPVVVLEPTS
ncbi:MAG: nitroreductase family deazaflavin-dependent oxidoreductase [Microthrixaceae bacterium]|nr:nitroreductase family deazaflavin-dependent oxidoreductase [Microthrixaceae bacterium]MCB9386225.1 nitroreductase family deazaflavin-dependent oxidoreductase [Microthrixaceae bacterium]MCO5322059.1 nitroreductase family deazaflavin-dependent oxidoreductase [Microthrixaceae bacterium]